MTVFDSFTRPHQSTHNWLSGISWLDSAMQEVQVFPSASGELKADIGQSEIDLTTNDVIESDELTSSTMGTYKMSQEFSENPEKRNVLRGLEKALLNFVVAIQNNSEFCQKFMDEIIRLAKPTQDNKPFDRLLRVGEVDIRSMKEQQLRGTIHSAECIFIESQHLLPFDQLLRRGVVEVRAMKEQQLRSTINSAEYTMIEIHSVDSNDMKNEMPFTFMFALLYAFKSGTISSDILDGSLFKTSDGISSEEFCNMLFGKWDIDENCVQIRCKGSRLVEYDEQPIRGTQHGNKSTRSRVIRVDNKSSVHHLIEQKIFQRQSACHIDSLQSAVEMFGEYKLGDNGTVRSAIMFFSSLLENECSQVELKTHEESLLNVHWSQSLLDVKQVLLDKWTYQTRCSNHAKRDLLHYAQQIDDALTPIELMYNALEGKTVTSSLVRQVYHVVITKMQQSDEIEKEKFVTMDDIMSHMKKSFDFHFNWVRDNEHLNIAECCDPRFASPALDRESSRNLFLQAMEIIETLKEQTNGKKRRISPTVEDGQSNSRDLTEKNLVKIMVKHKCDAELSTYRYLLISKMANVNSCPFQWFEKNGEHLPIIRSFASMYLLSPVNSQQRRKLNDAATRMLGRVKYTISSSDGLRKVSEQQSIRHMHHLESMMLMELRTVVAEAKLKKSNGL